MIGFVAKMSLRKVNWGWQDRSCDKWRHHVNKPLCAADSTDSVDVVLLLVRKSHVNHWKTKTKTMGVCLHGSRSRAKQMEVSVTGKSKCDEGKRRLAPLTGLQNNFRNTVSEGGLEFKFDFEQECATVATSNEWRKKWLMTLYYVTRALNAPRRTANSSEKKHSSFTRKTLAQTQ